MNQNSNQRSQQNQWLGQVMKVEQAILDGHMPPIGQLLAIPADIRMHSPLLLRAECEHGLLHGPLLETKQRLEAALRGFAAQADETAMLAMMAMLALLYGQVGDAREATPFLALLTEEWERNPENCSGFVPWALARAAANRPEHAERFREASGLFAHAAERFREERKPNWTGFVLLDSAVFDAGEKSKPDWAFWMNWLKRHSAEHPHADAALRVLTAERPDASVCGKLPLRFACLSLAALGGQCEDNPPAELADDIEIMIYAEAAKARAQLAAGKSSEAAESLDRLERHCRLLSTPAIERLAMELRQAVALSRQAALDTGNVSNRKGKRREDRTGGTGQTEETGLEQDEKEAVAIKWQVKLFGGTGFGKSGGQWKQPVWRRRKAGELFAYLLLQPNYKSNREQVIEKVFGEGEPAKRSNQLYVTLHDLRSALKDIGMQEETVYAKRGVIGISEQVVDTVDCETFVTLSRVGDQLWTDDREAACRLYDKALPLYGIAGVELPRSEWLERIREQLLDRQTSMLRRLAAYHSEQGDEAREEQRLSDWIELRPDHEEAYGAMIRLCLRSGRRVEAISWYRRLERICREELGIEPFEEIRELLWN